MPEIIIILLEENIIFILLIFILTPTIPIIKILYIIITTIKEVTELEINPRKKLYK